MPTEELWRRIEARNAAPPWDGDPIERAHLDGDVVLLLDANDAAAFVRNAGVAADARRRLATKDAETGWLGIWLIGHNCFRLWPRE